MDDILTKQVESLVRVSWSCRGRKNFAVGDEEALPALCFVSPVRARRGWECFEEGLL